MYDGNIDSKWMLYLESSMTSLDIKAALARRLDTHQQHSLLQHQRTLPTLLQTLTKMRFFTSLISIVGLA
jgi:hypothetical protein